MKQERAPGPEAELAEQRIQRWLTELRKLPKDQKLSVTTEDDPELVGIEEEMTAGELIDILGFVLGHDSPEQQEIKAMGYKRPSPEFCSIVNWKVKKLI